MKQNKIIIGAGQTRYDGWIATQLDTLDAKNPADWQAILQGQRADRVLAEHVFEHLTEAQTHEALKNIAAILSPKGMFRIAVPDGYHPDPEYIDYVRPGGTAPGADDHKILYTYKTLSAVIEQADLQVRLIEYFDEKGCFHAVPWRYEDGHIMRCAALDGRNKDRPYSFTSLIADITLPV